MDHEVVEADVGRRADHDIGRIADQCRDAAGIGKQRRREEIGNRRDLLGLSDQDDQRAENDDGGDVVQQQGQHRDGGAEQGQHEEKVALAHDGDLVGHPLEPARRDHDGHDGHHGGQEEDHVPVDRLDGFLGVVEPVYLAHDDHGDGPGRSDLGPLKAVKLLGEDQYESDHQDDRGRQHVAIKD